MIKKAQAQRPGWPPAAAMQQALQATNKSQFRSTATQYQHRPEHATGL